MIQLVSVIMSAYNTEMYLAEAIESVLEQTYRDFELIIINDGSTDKTLEIIQDYQAKDDRIKLISHDNIGLAASLNKGLEEAKGELIIRFDADDIMLNHRIEEQVNFMNTHPKIGMSSCHCYFIDENGNTIGKQKYSGYESEKNFKETFQRDHTVLVSHTGFICRKEDILKVGGYRILPIAEDKDLFTRMAEQGSVLVVQDKFLMKYRVHGSSVMASELDKQFTSLVASAWVGEAAKQRQDGHEEPNFDDFKEQLTKSPKWRLRSYAFIYYKAATVSYAQKKYFKLFYFLIKSFWYSPSISLNKLSKLWKNY